MSRKKDERDGSEPLRVAVWSTAWVDALAIKAIKRHTTRTGDSVYVRLQKMTLVSSLDLPLTATIGALY